MSDDGREVSSTPKYRRDKREARHVAHKRGHILRNFTQYALPSGLLATAICRQCGAYVQVLQSPSANEIDIGGPAVAVNCKTL